MARREGGDPAFGQGQKRGEEMIVNEPVNPLIKYSKPVSSLTSVGRRKGLYDRNGSWRGRKEGRFIAEGGERATVFRPA